MSNLLPCPFCSGAVSRCDESPLYGGSIMHDETECLFKNNLLFHKNIAERWNSRPLEDTLRARIAELESFLCLGEQLDHLLECYGESDEPMTKGAEAIRDWMQEHVIKPKQRIAELEKELRIYDEAIRDCAIDRSLGGNRPVSEYIADARKNLSAPPEEAK